MEDKHKMVLGPSKYGLYPFIFLNNRRMKTYKKLNEKSRKCHNHKPQPTRDAKRKSKKSTRSRKQNQQMHEKHTNQLSLPQDS